MKWHAYALAFLGAQFAFVTSLAVAFGYYQPPPFVKYFEPTVCLISIAAGSMALWRLRTRPASPFAYLKAQDWTELQGFALAMILVWLQFVVLTWGKTMIPLAAGMWADPILADFESVLLGQDAWRYLPIPNRPLDIIYSTWAPTIGILFSWFYFSGSERREAGLLAFFLTIGIAGTFGQYLLPSGGPIFFERLGFGDRFGEMVDAPTTTRIATDLWNAYSVNYIGFATGISAFPSIHVAGTTWFAIVARRWWAFAYLAVIYLGSISLGWHYAVDGIVGGAGAVGCYWLAKRMVALRLRIPVLVGEKL
jgi:hypothetical protein